jgi:hypothetical protein
LFLALLGGYLLGVSERALVVDRQFVGLDLDTWDHSTSQQRKSGAPRTMMSHQTETGLPAYNARRHAGAGQCVSFVPIVSTAHAQDEGRDPMNTTILTICLSAVLTIGFEPIASGFRRSVPIKGILPNHFCPAWPGTSHADSSLPEMKRT